MRNKLMLSFCIYCEKLYTPSAPQAGDSIILNSHIVNLEKIGMCNWSYLGCLHMLFDPKILAYVINGLCHAPF